MIQSKKALANLTVATGENWIGNMSNKELKEIFELGRLIFFGTNISSFFNIVRLCENLPLIHIVSDTYRRKKSYRRFSSGRFSIRTVFHCVTHFYLWIFYSAFLTILFKKLIQSKKW